MALSALCGAPKATKPSKNLMSKYDLLSEKESQEALSHGWLLSDVYDIRLKRWLVVVLPAAFGRAPLFTAADAAGYVIECAKRGHALSTKALRLVMAGPVVKPKPKTKAK